jgi:cupin fold WbuC family metalloprotein
LIKITEATLDEATARAAASPRLRANWNFHSGPEAALQRFLNAIEPGTYLRPHRHVTPPKEETFLVLRGRALVVEFDDEGRVTDQFVLDASGEGRGVEIAGGVWHSFAALERGTVLYELKQGPFDAATDKEFAEWAPEEGSDEAGPWLGRLLKGLGL